MGGRHKEGEGQETSDSGHLSSAGTRAHTVLQWSMETTAVMALTAEQGRRSVAIDPSSRGNQCMSESKVRFHCFLGPSRKWAKYHTRSVGALSLLGAVNYLVHLSSSFAPSLTACSINVGQRIVPDVSACSFTFPLSAQFAAAVRPCKHRSWIPSVCCLLILGFALYICSTRTSITSESSERRWLTVCSYTRGISSLKVLGCLCLGEC